MPYIGYNSIIIEVCFFCNFMRSVILELGVILAKGKIGPCLEEIISNVPECTCHLLH